MEIQGINENNNSPSYFHLTSKPTLDNLLKSWEFQTKDEQFWQEKMQVKPLFIGFAGNASKSFCSKIVMMMLGSSISTLYKNESFAIVNVSDRKLMPSVYSFTNPIGCLDILMKEPAKSSQMKDFLKESEVIDKIFLYFVLAFNDISLFITEEFDDETREYMMWVDGQVKHHENKKAIFLHQRSEYTHSQLREVALRELVQPLTDSFF